MPGVEGRLRSGPIDRIERRLRKIAASADNPSKLKWQTRMGPPLTRAFATLLLVGDQGVAPRMASMKTPAGELKYAYRGGNVPKRALVAVQHHRHPTVRILGYREIAKDLTAVAWASAERIILKAIDEAPPEAWYDLVLPSLDIGLEREEHTLSSPSYSGHDDPQDPAAPIGIEITLSAGPVRFRIDEATLRDHERKHKRGIIATLAEHFIGLDAEKHIQVQPTGTPTTCKHGDRPCAWSAARPEPGTRNLAAWRSGLLHEVRLLEHLKERWEETAKAHGGPLYTASGTCYGDDRNAFLDALSLDDAQRDAITRFLDAGPDIIILSEASLGKMLEAVWDHAPTVLADLHPDPDELTELLARHRRSSPTNVLDEVLAAKAAKQALAGYPRYDNLPTGAAAADRITRAYHIGGAPRAIDTIDKELKRETHKGILWAALDHLGAAQGREWQFTKNDQDAGEFLRDATQALFTADAAGYHDALAAVHTLSGGSGELPKPAGKR